VKASRGLGFCSSNGTHTSTFTRPMSVYRRHFQLLSWRLHDSCVRLCGDVRLGYAHRHRNRHAGSEHVGGCLCKPSVCGWLRVRCGPLALSCPGSLSIYHFYRLLIHASVYPTCIWSVSSCTRSAIPEPGTIDTHPSATAPFFQTR